MIKGYCRTNLDDYKRCEWPKKFAFPPLKDQSVAAKSGEILHVYGITHFIEQASGEPQIIVELHKPSWQNSLQ